VSAGVALWLAAARHQRRTVRTLAAILLVVAGLTLGEYASGVDLGLDQLLAADRAPVPPTAIPGRMGINTAIGFVLIGLALMLSQATLGRRRRLSQWLGLAGATLGVVGLIGYAYSVQTAYALTAYTQMAVHTAVLLPLLGLGTMFINEHDGIAGVVTSSGPGGQFMRSVLPYVFLRSVRHGMDSTRRAGAGSLWHRVRRRHPGHGEHHVARRRAVAVRLENRPCGCLRPRGRAGSARRRRAIPRGGVGRTDRRVGGRTWRPAASSAPTSSTK
jgi:hypothetical protein